MRRFDRIIVSTSNRDPAKAVVGSSPFLGDVSSLGIILPPDPTLAIDTQRHRYLVRLCGIQIGPDCLAIIRSVRQYLTIATEIEIEQGGPYYLYEMEVNSPSWNFVDGNISWHILKRTPSKSIKGGAATAISSVGNPPGYSPDIRGIASGVLYHTLPTSVDPLSAGYQPPNGGEPPGKGIENFSTWKDLRFSWRNFNNISDTGVAIRGPGDICMYASVCQTNPETRVNPPAVAEGFPYWLIKEDQFVYAYQNSARYYRIAGELVIDLCKLEEGD